MSLTKKPYVRVHKDTKNRVLQNVAPIEYTIDAAGKTLGRVASDAAQALLGKKSPHYVQNKVLPVTVNIVNAKKLSLSEKRVNETVHRWFTGQVDGLREITLKNLIAKKGIAEALRMAVQGMIPRNSLRKERMKRLTITD